MRGEVNIRRGIIYSWGRVRVGGGPEQVRESVTARGYWRPRHARPFPNLAHRTGRAVCPHPALGRVSHQGMHRRAKMEAPQLEHPQCPEDSLAGEAPRPSRGDLVPSPQEVPHALVDV
jgi:hypothetical protein